LKIYLSTLNLIQNTLPMFFRTVTIENIKEHIEIIIIGVLNKSSDLKIKVREASE